MSQGSLPHEIPTLADILSSAGYKTHGIGKFHHTPMLSPQEYGFHESRELWMDGKLDDWDGPYYGFEKVKLVLGHGEDGHGHYRHWLRKNYPEIAQKVEKGNHTKPHFKELPDLLPTIIPEEAHASTWIGNQACDFLEEQDPEKPFFLYLGFADPHSPYSPPASLAKEFEERETLTPRGSMDDLTNRPAAWEELKVPKGLSPECIRLVRQYTDAMIHLIDQNVGRVIQKLKETGRWEETIVIFTSDHGDWLGDYGLLRKSNLCTDSLVHVPFIMRVPGKSFDPHVKNTVSLVDVVPTLCELLQCSSPEGIQGQSMLSTMAGKRHHVLVQNHMSKVRYNNFSIYDDRYRFTLYPSTGEVELFDHTRDPSELHNLAESSQFSEVQREMEAELGRKQLEFHTPLGARVAYW